MYNPDLENYIAHIVERSIKGAMFEQHALVTSYDPDTHSAKVTLQPEGQETGWIPINALHSGNGFGIVVGLQVGDQVTVQFTHGDIDSAKITGRLHSDEDKPPRAESGEIVIHHQTGTKLVYGKDGSWTFTHAKGPTMTFDADGHLTHDMGGKKAVIKNASEISYNPG